MLNVLIADDDRNLCECLLHLIPWKDIGCNQPDIAYNGLEAWELLGQNQPDILICDLKMPVMGGVDLSRKIRETALDIEIIFLSAYEDFETARLALQYRVSDYILKPVTRECLDKLENLLKYAVGNKQKKMMSERLLGGEYSQEMLDALCSSDREFVSRIFTQLRQLKDADILNVCIWQLHVLYDYQCMMNSNADRKIYDALYKKWCNDLIKLVNRAERIDYVEALYEKEISERKQDSEIERIVRRTKQIVEENYASQECNVAWIADKLHMTSGYIGRIFGKYSGIGLIEYITECRLKQACILLETESCSIAEIAQKVGYSDSNYFTKLFRNKLGMSPSEYRRKKK